MIVTLLYFFFVFLGLGIIISNIFKVKYRKTTEKIIMSLGIGLGAFPILACMFHILHLPIHYFMFLPFIFGNLLWIKEREFKYDWQDFIVFGLFILLLIVLLKGSFGYEHLADDDSWGHALGAKFISIEKTAWVPENFYLHYVDPYPPSYEILMAILHQLNNSVSWTLKFFNSLLCGLAILFFYFFCKVFTNNKMVSLYSTFILFCIPCFMSRFIWAQTLAIVIMIVAFYLLIKIENYKDMIITGVVICGVFLTQPSTSVVFLIMLGLYYLVNLFYFPKKSFNIFYAIAFGIILSLIFYWLPMFSIYGVSGTLEGIGLHSNTLTTGDTSYGVKYGLKDFIVAPIVSKMDQPTGLGIFIFFMLVLYLFVILINRKKLFKMKHLVITLIWFMFTLFGVLGNSLPIKMFPHRFWVFFAIPVSILVGEVMFGMGELLKKNYQKVIIIGIIIIGVLITSFIPKYVVQNSVWPAGQQIQGNEYQGIYYLKTLPPNTKVFNYYFERDLWVIGVDKLSYEWKSNVIEFRKILINSTTEELYSFLKENEYEYLFISGMMLRNGAYWYGENATINHLNGLLNSVSLNSNMFIKVYESQGSLLYKVI